MQYAIKNSESIGMWNNVEQEETVRVAVIDTGVDYKHIDLKNRVNIELGYDFVNNDNDPMDDNGHGTHVTGIIAAETNNNEGISGIVGELDVEIMPIKVLDEKGRGKSEDIADGIIFAVDNGADIINLSLGGTSEDIYVTEAIEYAIEKGVMVIAAAGNERKNADEYVPAGVDGVYTVAASTITNRVAKFSNYGECVDIAAPGVSILSTIPGDRYAAWDGTSMAAPIVSGIAAVMIGEDSELKADEIIRIFNESAKDISSDGEDIRSGYGIIDGNKALELLNKR